MKLCHLQKHRLPRDSHTEWGKSGREKQISCINRYMWNLEKWYRWAYLQDRDRGTNICREQMYGHQVGRGVGGNREIGIDINTVLCIKQIKSENFFCIPNALWWPKWEGNSKKRGNIYVYIYIYVYAWLTATQQKIMQHCKATILQ